MYASYQKRIFSFISLDFQSDFGTLDDLIGAVLVGGEILQSDLAVPLDLSVVTHALKQPVGNTGRAA